MKVIIGADHGGFSLKKNLIAFLKSAGHEVIDGGNNELDEADDFPQFAGKVCSEVLANEPSETRGIVLCRNGQGRRE